MPRVSLTAAFLAAAGFASAASACDGCKKSTPAARPATPSNGGGAFNVSAPIGRTPAYGGQFHDPATCVDGQCESRSHQGHDAAECVEGICHDASGCTDGECGRSHAAPAAGPYRPTYTGQFRRPTRTNGTRPFPLGMPAGRRFHDSLPSETAPPPNFDDNRVPSPFYGSAAVASVCPVDGRPIETAESPVSVSVSGRTVWLCCETCESELRLNPTQYLGQSRNPFAPQPAAQAHTAAILEQEICPVTGERLDPSGEIWRVWIAGRPVFVCCQDCVGRLVEMARRELGTTPR